MSYSIELMYWEPDKSLWITEKCVLFKLFEFLVIWYMTGNNEIYRIRLGFVDCAHTAHIQGKTVHGIRVTRYIKLVFPNRFSWKWL